MKIMLLVMFRLMMRRIIGPAVAADDVHDADQNTLFLLRPFMTTTTTTTTMMMMMMMTMPPPSGPADFSAMVSCHCEHVRALHIPRAVFVGHCLRKDENDVLLQVGSPHTYRCLVFLCPTKPLSVYQERLSMISSLRPLLDAPPFVCRTESFGPQHLHLKS
jgi:hypothetical protein